MAHISRAKRARRAGHAAPPPALSGSSPLHLDRIRDWANGLSTGPVGLIAERVLSSDVADYVRFRAAWRACSEDPRAHGVGDRRFHPRRWIMLPPPPRADDNAACRPRRRFLNVDAGERIPARGPDLRSHYLYGATAEGLLVVCKKGTLVVELHNPLTGQRAEYPRATTLLDRRTAEGLWFKHVRLRSAGLAGDSTLAAIVHRPDSGDLVVAKPGDERWTRISLGDTIMAALPFQGRLYCVTHFNILVLDTTAAAAPPRLLEIAEHELDSTLNRMDPVYDDDGLILVHRNAPGDDYWPLYCSPSGEEKHVAYRAKLDTDSLVPMHGLGGSALFVGPGRSKSVSVPARICKSVNADTVYVCHISELQRYCVHGTLPPKALAFDLLGGCSEANFGKRGIAYYLLRESPPW